MENFDLLPITDLSIVANRQNCPARYLIIDKTYDTKSDFDLWKDGIFSKKSYRFICYTKEYPINDTFNVIEDIKVTNEKNVHPGYIVIEHTSDTNDVCFQKKFLQVKLSLRYFTNRAVSDIIALTGKKIPPKDYMPIGEINGYSLCARYTILTEPKPLMTHRILSASKKRKEIPNEFRVFNGITHETLDLNMPYDPLDGVPFQINPVYLKSNKNFGKIDTDLIDKYANLNEFLANFSYNFNAEKCCLSS